MPVDVLIRPFNHELDFEKALAEQLTQHGWEPNILVNPTEKELIKNWAAIIYNNNREQTRLGDCPLTEGEMQQIIDKVNECRNPYEVSKFINGDNNTQVSIRRDNPKDLVNCGKDVYLKLFDPREIRAGQSTYQIVRQPKFETQHPLASERRGDVMLLINGMPFVHIELKRSGVDVTQAVNQIKKYTHEGVFSRGIFSLVQIFVAMTPEKTLYFANPGAEENFSSAFQFHWADFNNNEIFDWKRITANLLSIPMAHQMIGFYTIADDKDETLKVLRSYQYYAANKISDRVHSTNWDDHYHKGGFVWHTTGSGKTMTSFKSAQLIANSGDADKVVFLLDRVELSVQSLDEYRGFAGENDSVQDSENTNDLVRLLESDDKDDCLIVTSLQKMSRINRESHIAESTINKINNKRVVFIIDECHRGMYGSMLMSIKHTFPRAVLFGFTGTPVFEANAHGEITTEVIFGDMLHKYTLASGIPDGNVLGFDRYKEETFNEQEIREQVAFNELDIKSFDEIGDNQDMLDIYNKIMYEEDIIKIESRAKKIYMSDKHHEAVVRKIVEERPRLSRNGMFHAILATKNIPEAIAYYEIFKQQYPEYNVAAVFDDSIDNVDAERSIYKEDAILEMLEDYDNRFGTDFKQSTYAKYKKDVAKRLAHKKPYQHLDKDHQLDILIVVTQMLTGYDSKWVNTLYVDKLMQYIDIIQAFSRTNRLFGPEKPFGIIKFFTCPNKMEQNIQDALELYVDQPLSVFTDQLEANLDHINKEFATIKTLFEAEGIEYFASLPRAEASRKKFAKEFCQMTKHLEAAKMQGFYWDKADYEFQHTNRYVKVHVDLDEQTYMVLLQRYRELFTRGGGGDGGDDDVYELEPYITETGLGTIDAEYINSKFIRFIKNLYTTGPGSEQVIVAQKELHNAFASLSQRDQRTAILILHDIQSGDLRLSPDKTIYDYINDYQRQECDRQIYTLAEATGLDADKLRAIISRDTNEYNIDEQGRFTELTDTRDKDKAKEFIKRVYKREIQRLALGSLFTSTIRRFILDPADRNNIIFCYQSDTMAWSETFAMDVPEPEEEIEIPDTTVVDNPLSDQEKCDRIRLSVLHDLRGLYQMPEISDVVENFFKIIELPSLNQLDGLQRDMKFAFDTLFAHNNTNIVLKHVSLGNLLVKFEVFLKKLYYLLNDREIEPRNEGENVTLANAIHAFECLWTLRNASGEKYQTLAGYLKLIRDSRNAEEAHASTYDSEEILDKKIHAVVTMYMYVTAMHLKDLKFKFDL